MATFRAVAVLLVIAIVCSAVLAESALQAVRGNNSATSHGESRQVVAVDNQRWWPWNWWPWGGGYGGVGWGWGWGWGWGIAAFVLAIVKGSILLGLFAIWAFFRGFAKKGGCAPIIIRESPPPIYSHHPWDRSGLPDPSESYARTKRAADYTEDPLYWTDMITDFAFSFLGVHSQDCRKRFVCEVDVRARRDPLLQLGMQMFGGDIFRKYRGENDKVAKDFGECARIYGKCKHGGPSISFNVITTQVEPLLDYEDAVGHDDFPQEEVTQEDVTGEEEVTTTTTEVPQKKYFNKKKRYFKIKN